MRRSMIAASLAAALALVACGGDSELDALQAPEPFEGGLSGFADKHVLTESYWYSRYNLGALVMKSGAGETFMPDATMVQMMVDMVSDDLSAAAPPSNPALLSRVSDGADPAYAQAPTDPMDFAGERWVGGVSATTSGAAFGWTVIKEVEWAKQFHVDAHFGVPGANDIPGAMERFAGVVLYAESVMQAMELMNAPAKFTMARPADRYVAMLALSDLALITAPDALPHSSGNRYKATAAAMAESMGMSGSDLAAMFRAHADDLYFELPPAESLEEQALAIQALAFYGAASATDRDAVRGTIALYADQLAVAEPATTLERAAVLQGLVSASRAVGPDEDWDRAIYATYEALLADYDGKRAVFADVDGYAVDHVATLLRALNAVSLYDTAVPATISLQVLRDVFENTVDVSGLQISAPPVDMIPEYERLPDPSSPVPLFHRYDGMPTPDAAGGEFGIAPVYAARVAYDPASDSWTAASGDFDTAGAMHLANEMLWFHADEVDGFPVVP